VVERGSGNLHLLATSRKEHDIRGNLGRLGAGQFYIQIFQVNPNARRHIRACLAKDAVLREVPAKVKVYMETKLGGGAHGVWVAIPYNPE
jgi:hypothetical protein